MYSQIKEWSLIKATGLNETHLLGFIFTQSLYKSPFCFLYIIPNTNYNFYLYFTSLQQTGASSIVNNAAYSTSSSTSSDEEEEDHANKKLPKT
jgi:hypothetical protein